MVSGLGFICAYLTKITLESWELLGPPMHSYIIWLIMAY